MEAVTSHPVEVGVGAQPAAPPVERRGTFVDLYAGAGGLSLGLILAGWKGLFAIERNAAAFETLKHNLIEGTRGLNYDWPSWLPKKNFRIGAFIKKFRERIAGLKGQVDLVVGGPPCQGFSLAGKRRKTDPRNVMFRHYVEFVGLVRPRLLLLENVKGIDVEFGKAKQGGKRKRGRPPKAFSRRIKESLEKLGYHVFVGLIKAADCGVPQTRPRYFIFALDKEQLEAIDETLLSEGGQFDPLVMLKAMKGAFLVSKGLSPNAPVRVRDAISDLETEGKDVIDCLDSPGFKQIVYDGPSTPFQVLLHGDLSGTAPNSMRLARHRDETVSRFKLILGTCKRGVTLSQADRQRLGMKKHSTVPLDGDKPSHTLTTLPDDLLHYSEPRILTAREYARLQAFPDWYEFQGNYTTGGKQRVRECPRYTQIGNAVPPLLAELIGTVLTRLKELLFTTTRLAPAPGSELPLAA